MGTKQLVKIGIAYAVGALMAKKVVDALKSLDEADFDLQEVTDEELEELLGDTEE